MDLLKDNDNFSKSERPKRHAKDNGEEARKLHLELTNQED